ncbi:Uncharacterised protein [uncultured archaeon]|nr:Uncharacterised protein [uncultured archaeon]
MSIFEEYEAKRNSLTDEEKLEADKYRLGDFIPVIGELKRMERGANIDPWKSGNARLYHDYQTMTVTLPVVMTAVKIIDYLM